jgi:hypothetical protein
VTLPKPKIGHFKYLLVTVGHHTHWVEATTFPEATATNVIRVLLENIIPMTQTMGVILPQMSLRDL